MAVDHVPSGTEREYTLYRSPRAPRALLAGTLSVLLPGAGQVYAGSARRGLVMLGGVAVLGAAVLLLWSRGSLFVLRLLVQPRVLLALLAAVLVAFAAHAAAVVDAYALAGRRRRRPARSPLAVAGRLAALLALVAALAVPYGTAAYYDFRSYDLLTTVFAEEDPFDPSALQALAVPPPASPPPVAPPPAEPPVEAAPPPGQGPYPSALATTAGAGSETAPPERPSYWRDRGRLNLLLLGGDAGPGRYGLRTDTMIVASISLRTGRTALFGVPRNLQSVPFPRSAQTSEETFGDILNALWGYAEARSWLFPGAKRPGPAALKETIGNLLGLRIDYYAAVDLRGFVEVVDALGGVTVDVQRRVYDAGVSPPVEGEPWIVVDLEPGRHRLDGRTALGYVRTRWATSDYDRMQRQRCLVGALIDQASVPRLLRSFPKLASVVKEFVQTDVPLKALPDLIELVGEIDERELVGVSFVPPRFSPRADVEAMRAAVQAALRGAGAAGAETGVDLLRGSCR